MLSLYLPPSLSLPPSLPPSPSPRKQCEAAKKDLNTQSKYDYLHLLKTIMALICVVRQKGQEHEAAVKSLREEMDTLTSGKIDTERKLNEMEQAFRVCENLRSSIGGSSQQQQQGQVSQLVFSYFENQHTVAFWLTCQFIQ